ncbi:MAG TPA: TIGR03067 domain-containing protein [Humisphaera sp.]|jgi:uncharacterized protein (TIGR03067 family)|nr:TIGR03067 domain-containing protein [Humisphaera sp.]
MKASLFLGLLSLVLIAADKPKDIGAQDRQKLQGAWQFVQELHGDSDTSDEGKHCQFIFDGDKFTVKKDDKEILSGTFTIDTAKSPAQIDLKILKDDEEERNGQTSLGIYQLDGDKLKVCACEPSRDQRPGEFATKGTDLLMVVMERVKK